jgi:hypothetical protein
MARPLEAEAITALEKVVEGRHHLWPARSAHCPSGALLERHHGAPTEVANPPRKPVIYSPVGHAVCEAADWRRFGQSTVVKVRGEKELARASECQRILENSWARMVFGQKSARRLSDKRSVCLGADFPCVHRRSPSVHRVFRLAAALPSIDAANPMNIPPDAAERIRKALWNLMTLQQLHLVVGQLQKETEALLKPFNEPEPGDGGASPFKQGKPL